MAFDPSSAVLDERFDPDSAVLDDSGGFDPDSAVLDEVPTPAAAPRAPRRGGTRAEFRPYAPREQPSEAAMRIGADPLSQPRPAPDWRPDAEQLSKAPGTLAVERNRRLADAGRTSAPNMTAWNGPSPVERVAESVRRATGSNAAGELAAMMGDKYVAAVNGLLTTPMKIGADIAQMAGAPPDASRWLQYTRDAANAAKSQGARAASAGLTGLLRDPETGPLDVIAFMAAHPSYLVDQVIESGGPIGLSVGSARGAGALFATLAERTGAGAAKIEAARAAGAVFGERLATALTNAGDTFDATQAATSDKYVAAFISGAGTVAVGKLTRGGAEGVLASGRAPGGAATRVGAVTVTAGREALQEGGEALAGEVGRAVGEGNALDPNVLAKHAAADLTIGGGMGAFVGARAPLRDRTPSAESIASSKGFLAAARAPRVEDMPTTVLRPEELPQRPAVQPVPADPAAAEPVPTPTAPTRETQTPVTAAHAPGAQPTARGAVGAAALPQGSLAARAEPRAETIDGPADPLPPPEVGAVAPAPARSSPDRGTEPGAVAPGGGAAAQAAGAHAASASVRPAALTSNAAPRTTPAQSDAEPFRSRTDALAFVAAHRLGKRVDVVDTGDGFVLTPKALHRTPQQLAAFQEAIDDLAARIEQAGAPGRAPGPGVRLVAVPDAELDGTAAGLVARAAETAFGIPVVAVRGGLGAAGATWRGRVYFDADVVSRPGGDAQFAVGLIGHEAGHVLMRDTPHLASRLNATVREYLREGAVERKQAEENAGRRNDLVSPEYAAEEVFADVNGAMWLDTEFWRRLYDLDAGSTFRRLLYQFMRAATKFMRVARGSRFDAGKHVTNVERVREAAAQVWAERAEGRHRTGAARTDKTAVGFARGDGNEDAPHRERIGDRRVSYSVRVLDSGEVATVTVEAQRGLSDLESRSDALRRVRQCLQGLPLIGACLEIADAIADEDRDDLLDRISVLMDQGTQVEQAQLQAVDDLLSTIEDEKAKLQRLLREQHPDLFTKPALTRVERRSQFFTNAGEDEASTQSPDAAASANDSTNATRIAAESGDGAPEAGDEQSPARDSRPGDATTRDPRAEPANMAHHSPFYSTLARGVEGLPTRTAPPIYWRDAIKGLINKGTVKAAEVEWSGVTDWLELQRGRIDKQQVLDYLAANGVGVEETVRESLMSNDDRARLAQLLQREGRGERLMSDQAQERDTLSDLAELADAETNPAATGYDEFQVPGGKRYRELLLTLSPRGRTADVDHPSAHWTDRNVLAALQVNERPDAQGRRVLFVEALQSDWATDRRERKKAPDAPFVGTGSANEWLPLAVKRVAKLAVDEGFDRVAFTTGAQNAKRFELRGAKAAGMRTFYDEMLPNIVSKTLSRLGGGATVNVDVQAGDKVLSQPGFDVTPEMRRLAGDPMPMFARADDNRGVGAPPEASRAPRPSAQRYQLRDFGRGAEFIQAVQDRYNRWKHTIDDIKEQGGVITEANDFYRAEERYWGKVGARLEDFQSEVDRFVKDVAADGLQLEDVQLYAYAKHARERNAYLARMRAAPDGFGAWSGMSDDEAQAILDDARQAGLDTQLERHRQTLQQWIQGTRDLMRDEGLVTPAEHERLSAIFADYVPLRGLDEKAAPARPRGGTGQGFDVRGGETRHTFGRRSEARQIIEHIVLDRARTLVRAGKNEVLRSFLAFVLDNPSPNLWEVNAVETRPFLTVDDDGNQVIERTEAIITDDRTVAIKDGGRAVHVRIKDPVLLEQMRNLHVQEVGRLVGVMLMAQRAMGRLYTTLSPVFTMMNWVRDAQAATIGMLDEVGAAAAAKLWAMLPHAIAEASRAELLRKPSEDYQRYRATGGKTGFMDFKDVDELSKQLTRQLANAERTPVDPRVWAPAALDLMDRVHSVVENSTRYAAFLVAREEGRTVVEAARISKNITVNFNRKGTLTPHLSAWFLFFNPAVQGTARVAQALRSPRVLATLGAGMVGIALLALRNAEMGDDDDGVAWWDKIPSEVKDRNLIVVLPPGVDAGERVPRSQTGRYIKIPMPYGWNFFATLANQAVDVWRGVQDAKRGAKPLEAALRSVTSLLGAYSPVSDLARSVESPRAAALAAVPDFANPIAQSLLNVNGFGRPLYPDDPWSRHMPDSSKAFTGQRGTVFQRAAEGLNAATGGSRYRSGVLDLTPGTIENLVRSYGGGPATFTLDMLNAVYLRQSIKRPDLEARRLPFVKQLYGVIDAETDRVASFERMEAIDSTSGRWERALREGHPGEARKVVEEFGEIARMGDFLREQRAVLAELRKQEMTVLDNERLTDDAKYARLLVLDTRKRVVLHRINRQFDRATPKTAAKEKAPAE